MLSACIGDASPPAPAPTAGATAIAAPTLAALSPVASASPILVATSTPAAATAPGATPQAGSDAGSPSAAAAWVQQHAVPLPSDRLAARDDDLQALEPLIGQARVVAVGQSVYGARGFVELQDRIVQYAVQRLGFSVIAVDLDAADAGAVDTFIHAGETPPELSASAPVDWRSAPRLALLLWLRALNQGRAPEAQVRVAAIGARPPWAAIRAIEAYIEQVEPAVYAPIATSLGCLSPFEAYPGDYAQQSPLTQVDCWTQLKSVEDMLQAKRAQYVAASSEPRFEAALANIAAVRQGEAVLAGGDEARQAVMAGQARVLAAQAGPDGRLLILAHNDYIGERAVPFKTMGAQLREQLGAQYVALALDAFEPGYTVLAPADTIPAHYSGSFDGPADSFVVLLGSPAQTLLLPLRPLAPADALPAWFRAAHALRSIDELYDPNSRAALYPLTVLPDAFDALIYVRDTCPVGLAFYRYPAPTDTDFVDPCSAAWQVSGYPLESYAAGADAAAQPGRNSLLLRSVATSPAGTAWVGQMARAEPYQGRRVRLTAQIKTEGLTGSAGPAFAAGGMQLLPESTQPAALLSGSHDWQQLSIELDVPLAAQTIAYGLVLRGEGKLWLGELRLDSVAAPAPTATPAVTARAQRLGGLLPLPAGKINLLAGLAILRMYSAAGPFSVMLEDAGGRPIESIFGENAGFNGAAAIPAPGAGPFLLNVQATGAWTIQVEQPDLAAPGASYPRLPQTFSGRGKQVSPPFALSGAPATFHVVYDGLGPLNAALLGADGQSVLTVANYDGVTRRPLDAVIAPAAPVGAGNYVLQVSAGGAFTITLQQ